ncbi:MAG: hypothetical protein FJW39_13650 [Acidobacteria bacterium]|nr:hypothetical protein [Acidobacteriota bacterium]
MRLAVAVLLPVLAAVGQEPSHWPLISGYRWELTAPGTAAPIVFEVSRRTADEASIASSSPAGRSTITFKTSTSRLDLSSIDFGYGLLALPPGLVYFDFSCS